MALDDILNSLKRTEEKLFIASDNDVQKALYAQWRSDFEQLYKYDSEALLYRAGEKMRQYGSSKVNSKQESRPVYRG